MEYLYLFFDTNQSFGEIEKGFYKPHLVALSYLVACFGSYVAISMMLYMLQARRRCEKNTLLWAGSFAMAAGIWAMHFIGMLSYKMDMVIEYDLPVTFLSFLIAFGVAYGAFSVVATRRGLSANGFAAAALLGLGICGMHYTGMAALRMDGTLRYQAGLFLLSVFIAIVAAWMALRIVFRLIRETKHRTGAKILAALVMGLAICGMHFIGMAAAVIRPYAECRYDPEQSHDFLAFSVAVMTGLILTISSLVAAGRRARDEEQSVASVRQAWYYFSDRAGLRLGILVVCGCLFAVPFLWVVNIMITEHNRVIHDLRTESCVIRLHQQMMQIVVPIQRIRGLLYTTHGADEELAGRLSRKKEGVREILEQIKDRKNDCGSTRQSRQRGLKTLDAAAAILAAPHPYPASGDVFAKHTEAVNELLDRMDTLGEETAWDEDMRPYVRKMEQAVFKYLPPLVENLALLRAKAAYLQTGGSMETESERAIRKDIVHLVYEVEAAERQMAGFMKMRGVQETPLHEINTYYKAAIQPGFKRALMELHKLSYDDAAASGGQGGMAMFDGMTSVVDGYHGFYMKTAEALQKHLSEKEQKLRQNRQVVFYSSGSAFLGFVGLFTFLYFSLVKLEGAAKRVAAEVNTVTLLRGVAETANGEQDVDEAMRLVLGLVCAYMGWSIGHVLAIDKKERVLKSRNIWFCHSHDGLGHFRALSESLDFGPGIGLPGRAWAMAVPVWEESMAQYAASPRHEAAREAGLGTGFAFPVFVDGNIEYVLEFFSTGIVPQSETASHMMGEIGGQLAQVIQRVRAIDNLRDMKERAEAANIAKSDFLANMSHELRTPLNSIIGMTRLLMESNLTRQQLELADASMRSSVNLLEIVNDILDLSKIEAGEIALEEIGFDLYYTIGSVSKSLKHMVKEKRLTIIENIQTGMPYVVGDPLRLSRILTNLIGNAIKYTGLGHISIKAVYSFLDADTIELFCEITDTGIGIREDKIDTIFDKFVQADSSITRKYGGTGLGLAITKQLVDLMKGRIGVRSKLGEGSTFWFRIPFKTTKILTSEKHRRRTTRYSGTLIPAMTRVLVAEDYALNQMLVRKILEKFNLFHYEIVGDGALAVEKYRQQRWDIILMDCQMPEKSGYEATEEIRAFEKAEGRPPAKIVAMTANAMSGERDKCLRHGMDDYISKPIDIMVLKDILSQWVRMEEAEEEIPSENFEVAEEAKGKTSSGVVSGKVDFSVLGGFSGGNIDMEKEFISMFEKQTEDLLEHMEKLLSEGKTHEWRAAAHKIKGGAGAIGADFLRELCDLAQNLEGDMQAFREKQNKIVREYGQVKIFLKANGRL